MDDNEMAPITGGKSRSYRKETLCKFWLRGFCRWGSDCEFRHGEGLEEGVAGEEVSGDGGGEEGGEEGGGKGKAVVQMESDEVFHCSICIAPPVVFGVLSGCDHVFCLLCIRTWRSTKPVGSDSDASKNFKTCPLCRVKSDFVVPSSAYPGSIIGSSTAPSRSELISTYRATLKQIPCRYFRGCVDPHQSPPPCPFLNDCFYAHVDETTGEPFVFKDRQMPGDWATRRIARRRERVVGGGESVAQLDFDYVQPSRRALVVLRALAAAAANNQSLVPPGLDSVDWAR